MREKIERFQQIIGYIVNSMLFYAGNWFTFPNNIAKIFPAQSFEYTYLCRCVCAESIHVLEKLLFCLAHVANNEIGFGVSLLGMNACDRWTICMSLIWIEIV